MPNAFFLVDVEFKYGGEWTNAKHGTSQLATRYSMFMHGVS
jgi:hypothetical protein